MSKSMKTNEERISLNFNDCDLSEENYQGILQAASVALSQEGIEDFVDISVSIVSPEEIRQLNKTYREVDSVTDVLSFPINESFDGHLELGDVVINLDRIKSQAQEFGHSFKHELRYLTVHSILHCLGYDHMTEEDKKEMRSREKKIMAVLDKKEVTHEEG